jgi:hypothetical protein
MHPVDVRRRFGKEIRMIGGFDKRIVAGSKADIAREVEWLRPVVAEGGYIPACDHDVPPNVSLENCVYFIHCLQSEPLLHFFRNIFRFQRWCRPLARGPIERHSPFSAPEAWIPHGWPLPSQAQVLDRSREGVKGTYEPENTRRRDDANSRTETIP